MLRSKRGVVLLDQLKNLDRSIEFAFFGERLIYQPQIEKNESANKEKIDELIPVRVTTAQESIKASQSLLKFERDLEEKNISLSKDAMNATLIPTKNHSVLGTVNFRVGQSCSIAFNVELASVKIGVVQGGSIRGLV